ncbi:hypothetical protein HGA91_03905 [candidate division WWE3 bacterium]|nr:hypothetical protein [candidate division WWE3 bacterium]
MRNTIRTKKHWGITAAAFFLVGVSLFLTGVATLPTNQDVFSLLNRKDRASAQSIISLTVDPSVQVNQFNDSMRGVSFVNWDHNWGRPFVGKIPGLTQVMRQIKPGLVRYAGGLVSNDVGWDRTTQKRGAVEWRDSLGNTYTYHYGTDEMEDLNAFADAIQADVMIQVNIAEENPSMWADMVKYTNKERGWNFKYWELGNELDYASEQNVTAQESGRLAATYQQAMRSVDSTIGIRGPAIAYSTVQAGPNTSARIINPFIPEMLSATRNAGQDLNGLTWHWYQRCNNDSGINGITAYSLGANVAREDWRNPEYRNFAQIYPKWIESDVLNSYPTTLQGVTELNFDACDYDSVLNGNHLTALWFADVLGRLAYNGVDFVTMYEGYATQGLSMVYATDDPPSRVALRPTYYTYLMYAKYFGDRMVKSSSSNEAQVSIWASTDAKDPGKLKLMVTNMTASNQSTSINLGSFNASGGQLYQMTSSNPTDLSSISNTESAPTTINGIKLVSDTIDTSVGQIKPTSLAVSGNQFSYTFPAWSATSIVLSSATGGTVPTSAPTVTPIRTTPTGIPATPTPISDPLIADINRDGAIDVFDLGILSANYNRRTSDDPANLQLSRSDINKDGSINVYDLGILIGVYENHPNTSSRSQIVYNDTLGTGFTDSSWGSTNNYSNTTPVRSGKSISSTFFDPWAAINFKYAAGLDVSSYNLLRFWIHGGTSGNQALQLYFYDDVNTPYQRYQLPLLKANEWMLIEVPFSNLGQPSKINGILLQSAIEKSQPTFFVDDISLVGGPLTGPTPTPTRAPTVTPLPTATPIPTNRITPTITPSIVPTVPAGSGSLKVMPLGDSVTEGVNGGYRNGVYTSLKSAGYSVDMVGSRYDQYTRVADKDHQGTPGYNTGNIADEMTDRMNTYRPDVVLLMAGVNDFAWWFTDNVSNVVNGTFSEIIDRIYAVNPNAIIVVGSITPMKGANAQGTDRDSLGTQYNQLIQAKVAQYKASGKRIGFADIYHSITINDLYDDVHPTESAHEKIAQTWINALMPLLR